MFWESSGVVGFDLGPLLEGQMRTAKLKSAYNSLIIGPRGFGALSLRWIQFASVLRCARSSLNLKRPYTCRYSNYYSAKYSNQEFDIKWSTFQCKWKDMVDTSPVKWSTSLVFSHLTLTSVVMGLNPAHVNMSTEYLS